MAEMCPRHDLGVAVASPSTNPTVARRNLRSPTHVVLTEKGTACSLALSSCLRPSQDLALRPAGPEGQEAGAWPMDDKGVRPLRMERTRQAWTGTSGGRPGRRHAGGSLVRRPHGMDSENRRFGLYLGRLLRETDLCSRPPVGQEIAIGRGRVQMRSLIAAPRQHESGRGIDMRTLACFPLPSPPPCTPAGEVAPSR